MLDPNFLNILKGLNDARKIEAVNVILAKFREKNASNPHFYDRPAEVQAVKDQLYSMIETTDLYLDALIRIEASGPYTIFSYIINEDFSDIVIHCDGINFSDSSRVEKYTINDNMKGIYHLFVQHFIENIMFITSQKFDTANSILDAELGIFRFNLIHQSLTISGKPIVVMVRD